MSGASVSEQEFITSFFGYEKYWIEKSVSRAEGLEEFEKFKFSGMDFNDYLWKFSPVYKQKKLNRKNKKPRQKKSVKKS